ncbi:MAG: DUF6531 domain-containing protein, partial [Azoarcus sp.]|nr:DUF6531 domain-containing protein [Azoarcus sp.]
MSTLQPAARLNDPIAHTPLLAAVGKMVGGLVVGALVGAAAGALAVFVVGTGGLGAVVAAAIISSLLMALGGDHLAAGITNLISAGIDALFPAEVTGAISTNCSRNVYINNKPAARAALAADDNTVKCGKHPPYPEQYIAEGSRTVFINNAPAHRKDDRSTCDAKTHAGSPNVQIGGEPVAVREITPEVPPWLQHVGTAIGIATALCTRNWKSIPSKLACLGLSMGISLAADAAVAAVFGHPVHAASGAKILDGEDDTDFALPARLTLEWARRYNSLDTRAGLLGPGWSVPVSVQLRLNQPGEHPNLFIDEQGREIPFTALAPGESQDNTAEGWRLCRSEGGHYIVAMDDGSLYYDFGTEHEPGPHTLDLLGLEDRNGNVLSLLRAEGDGRLLSLGDSAGRLYRCHYDTLHPQRLAGIELVYPNVRGHYPQSADPDWLVRYAYDAKGRLSEVRNRAGEVARRFTWHDSGPGADLLASHDLPEGVTAHYRWGAFDDHPRVIEHWDSLGNRWRADYDLASGTTRVTDQLGRVQQWRWDKRYAIIDHTNAANETWHVDRDRDGRKTALTQPNGGQWRYTYDARGNLASETDPTGATTRTEWRLDRALPKRETDALGQSTEYLHDELGNLIEIRDAAGSTTWQRDRYGQPFLHTAANGATMRWRWNEAGQVISHTDCSGHVTRYHYDHDGNLTSETDPLAQRTVHEYDRLGRPTRSTLPDHSARQWRWDAAGQLTAVVDGKGGVTEYQWEHGRLSTRVDAAGRNVDYLYDVSGNLTTLVNENNEAYLFEYDAVGRRIAQIGLDDKRTA